MASENNDSGKQNNFEWHQAKEPLPEIYSNFLHASWSLHDVRLLFGHLKPEYGNSDRFVVEERGAVSLAWAQAKLLATVLTRIVDKYEEANGEIKPIILPDKPEL